MKKHKLNRVAKKGIAIGLVINMGINFIGCKNTKISSEVSNETVASEDYKIVKYDVSDVTRSQYEIILTDINSIYESCFYNELNQSGENNILIHAYNTSSNINQNENNKTYKLGLEITNVTNPDSMKKTIKEILNKYNFTEIRIDDLSLNNMKIDLSELEELTVTHNDSFKGKVDLSNIGDVKNIILWDANVSKYPKNMEILQIDGRGQNENADIQSNLDVLAKMKNSKVTELCISDIPEYLEIEIPEIENIRIIIDGCGNCKFYFNNSKNVEIKNLHGLDDGIYYISGTITENLDISKLTADPFLTQINGNPNIKGKYNMLLSEMILHGYITDDLTSDVSLKRKKIKPTG